MNQPSSSEQELIDMILHEADRVVKVKDADGVIEMSTCQAIVRSLNVAAMKGDRAAAKIASSLLQKARSDKDRLRERFFEFAFEYKNYWDKKFAWCDAKGIARPDPIPHPDDFFLDVRKGEARFGGYWTADEKAPWDEAKKFRDIAVDLIDDYARRLKTERKKKKLKETWMRYQGGFDMFNDALPKRMQVQLKHRLREDGSVEETPSEPKEVTAISK